MLLIGLISVIALTWDKPLRQRLSEIPVVGQYVSIDRETGRPRTTRVVSQIRSQATPPPPNGAWMFDPNHKTVLDRPSYNQTHTFTNHVYYVDSNGAKYWLDGQGQRHYEP